MNRFLGRALWATAAAAATAATAFGQVVSDAVPLMSQQHILNAQQSGWQPAGPGDFHDAPNVERFSTFTTDPSQSVLNQIRDAPADGWSNPYPGPHFGGDKLQSDGVAGGGDSRFIDQPLDCSTGFFSNNNSNSNPYLRFEDFRAGASPLRNVKFYGGVYLGNINDISTIGVEIWTIQATGDGCGWTYQSFVGSQTFSLAEVNPVYNCTGNFFDTYEMQANFSSPIALNPGQVYMILIYATLSDPNGSGLFTWNQSTASNYNPAQSWDRTTQTYLGTCGPDMAFATNTASECFELDCVAPNCYFSNFTNNNNPYIVADDFTASATTDLRQLQFTGGGYDVGTFSPTLLGNIAGFYIELYTIAPDDGQTCGSLLTGFLGAYQVSMADARPVFQCIDAFGIPLYEFTVNIPANVYPLTAGTTYAIGIYGVPADPNNTELFCWGLTDGLYGLTSYSYNLDTGIRDVCHVADQAFCINGDRPCLGDFNMDGTRNTLDVLAFLNAWNARHPSSDINGDGVINTLDVLAFLNRWNIPC